MKLIAKFVATLVLASNLLKFDFYTRITASIFFWPTISYKESIASDNEIYPSPGPGESTTVIFFLEFKKIIYPKHRPLPILNL